MIARNGRRHRPAPCLGPHAAKHCGFTLIEVLVTIVLLAIGLLGLAGLQAFSLKNSHGSFYRSIASQQAADMADRIAANQKGVTGGYYDNLSATIPTNPNCINTTTPCTAQQVAVTDQYQWLRANAVVLPNGSGTVCIINPGTGNCVTYTAGATRIFRITVSWTERTDDDNVTQSFVTRFVP